MYVELQQINKTFEKVGDYLRDFNEKISNLEERVKVLENRLTVVEERHINEE